MLNAHQMHDHQVSLLTSVFHISDIREFMDKLGQPIQVPTWDGKARVWMTVDQIKRMHQEVCLLGPMAAMFGREVQQILMLSKTIKWIDMEEFQNSVNSGRASVSQQIADEQSEAADMNIDDDQASQTSKRTRSPRRALYRDVRSQEVDLRPANLRGTSSYIRSDDSETRRR